MKKGLFLLVLMAIGVMTFAQTQNGPEWNNILSNQPETFRTQLVSSSERSVKVNVQVPGFYTSNVTTPRGEAKIISLPKSVSTAKAGEPNVPMTGIPVMIGDKARMSARIVDAQYMDFENIEVAPSKGDFSRQIDPATVPYTYGECYNQDAFFPSSSLGLYEPYIIRDFRGQNMAVYPFVYNPVTKTLRVYYNMTVEMYKVDDNGTNVIESRRSNVVKMDPDFKSVYQRHFINYEESAAKYTVLDEEGDLLIICYSSFMDAMTDFVNWKKTRGINTTIVNASSAGSTYSAIQSYIQSQYNANNNLTHVLLVGDAAQIPGYTYSGGGSSWSGKGDNPYGQIVGSDLYNDVFIGRFSAGSAAQVTTQVNRIITYERDLTTSATWCQNGLGISASAGNGGHYNEDDYEHVENLRTDLLNYGYNTVYQDYASVSGYPSSSTTTISNHINSGVGIINYCNHGEETGWQSHYYMNSNVNALTNDNKLPFIFSVACLVGKYDYSSGDCFAETWMHATNGSNPTGAVSGMFSYISQPWIPPMWAQDEFVDILVESYNNNIKRSFGGAAMNGLFSIFDNYSTSSTEAVGCYQAWVLYGDPTLMMRTKTPSNMTVTHAGAIAPSASTYAVTVNNGSGAVATITDADHNILGKATVGSNGSATINISGTLTVGTELTLCVFGYNKVTYLGTINVVGSGNQYEITATASPTAGGTVTGAGTYYEDTQCTLTATPNRGYAFANWKKNNSVVSNNATYTFTVTASGSYTANFTALTSHTVTCNATQNGSISATPTTAYAGETITLTATPAANYALESWSVKDANNNTIAVNNNQFTMPDSNVTVSATFVFQQEVEVTIGSGTTSGYYLPTGDYYKYSLTQQIYTASELGEAGTITAISFYYNTATASNPRSLEIYMAHTPSSTITSWSIVTTGQRVYSGTYTFTQGWNTITLTTPFAYDGSSNLLLTVDDNTGNWTTNSQFYTYSTGANRAIYYRNDSTNPDPTGSVSVSATQLQVNAQMKVTKEIAGPSVPQYVVTATPNPVEGGTVAFGSKANRDELTYDFEDGWQGWTTFQGNTTSPNSWMHNTAYPTSNNDFSTGYGYNSSDGFMLSESYISGSSSGSGTAVTPDNYLVSPQVRLGGSISFYAGARNTEYCAEKFSVMVSTTDNTNAASFTTVGTWTLSLSSAGYTSSPYTVDLSAYSGMGYIAIRHYDCYDQWFLAVDNITIVEGDVDDGNISATFEENQSCTLVATPNTGYSFVNWTENGTAVSTNASYTFTVTSDRDLVANFSQSVPTYSITASANPTAGGTVSGAGSYAQGQTCTLVATANTGYTFVNWTKNGSVVSTNANYSFTVSAAGTYVANFTLNSYQITASADPASAGTVSGGGTYNHGATATLIATPADGYDFVNWTMNGTEVSTNATYSFTVTAGGAYVAHFTQSPEEQTVTLPIGWSWWSSYVEITIQQLENALGTSGASIVSQHGVESYISGYGWDGDINEIDLSQMYELNTTGTIELTVSSVLADPADHPITLNPNGYTWIGYPVQQSMNVADAFAGLNAVMGDLVKSKTSMAMYTGNSWVGTLNSLEPGQGYMYRSNATSSKTFTYPSSRIGEVKANINGEGNYWTPAQSRFANNMNVMAVVEFDGAEAMNDNIEVGAFVGDECRGSVRLMRVEETGRYMAFLTIHGETGESVSFRVLDDRGELEVKETMELNINAMVGDLKTPFVLHAGSNSMVLFPNPVTTGEAFSVEMPSDSDLNGARVEVYNALGNMVRTETMTGKDASFAGMATAGVYTVKVTDRNGNVNYSKLVVK